MRLFSAIILAFLVNTAYSQDAKALFVAIGNGDVEKVSAAFGNDMEICIGTKQDFYSKAEAKNKLKQFFGEVGPSSGSFLHKGTAKDQSSEYSVGVLNTKKGKYRVFVYFEGSQVVGLMFNPE
jgi:hypothetical protein